MMDERELEKRFAYHLLKEDQIIRYIAIQDAVKSLGLKINQFCPDGRYKSLAITKLEEVLHRSMDAISKDEGQNQQLNDKP